MSDDQRIVYLDPRDLAPSRQNIRSDPGDLAGLAETIREHGILQPLGITEDSSGGYRVVFGNRRRDAAIVVGLHRVPCIVLDAHDDEYVVVQQVLENLQRLDLNDLEKSRAFQRLLDRLIERGSSQGEALEEIARTLGLSVRQIQRYLRLLQLGPQVQHLIVQGDLGVTHAQHLVDTGPASRQEAIALLAVEETLSAAELGRLCAVLQRNANVAPRVALEALRRGERVAVVESRPHEPLPSMSAPPMSEPQDGGGAPWDEDGDDENAEDAPPEMRRAPRATPPPGHGEDFAHLEPSTRDGSRVRKIHSLDAFMDELQRLAQCVQEGDLQRFAGDDQAAGVKLRLAVRQLRFLTDAMEALVAVSPGGATQ